MNLVFSPDSLVDYLYWQTNGRAQLPRVNAILKDLLRSGGAAGIGHPEILSHAGGLRSRRIDGKNRVLYRVVGDDIQLVKLRGHYGDH